MKADAIRVEAVTPTAARPAVSQPGYRADIDGLRAVAVTSVVLYHAFDTLLPGGFVGVDVFFVISGFLIGGILHREVSSGKFSYKHFYARRARRILPALIALTVAVYLAGLLLYSGRELRDMGAETAAALIGVANVKYWLSLNYFAESSALTTMLMTWSLGVEEQFYVLFPPLLLLLRRAPDRLTLNILAGAALVSFGLSLWLTLTSPWMAFYLLPTRAWEMGVGVWLAIRLQLGTPARLPVGRAADALALAGLVAIGASLALYSETIPFPGYHAALPVLGTLALLATPGSFINRHLLASRPMVTIGLLSYSWYLWHWPLMVIARKSVDRAPSDGVMFAVVILSLAAAYVSWRWIEKPFRYAAVSSAITLRRFGMVLLVAVPACAALFVLNGVPQRLPPVAREADRLAAFGSGKCQREFGDISLPSGEKCLPAPGGAPVVALMGDSHANALGLGLERAARQAGYKLWQIEKSACFPLLGVTTAQAGIPAHSGQCGEFLARAVAYVSQHDEIKTVMLAGSWPADDDPRFNRFADGRVGEHIDSRRALDTGLPAMIRALRAAGKQVIIVGDVPNFGSFNPLRHAFNRAIPARSLLYDAIEQDPLASDTIPKDRLDPRFPDNRARIRVIAAREGAGYIDVSDQLCDARTCRHASNGVPLFVDVSHLSQAGSLMIDWSSVLPR